MMKLQKVLFSVLSAAAVLSTDANAASLSGTLTLTLTGTLRVVGTGYTAANCSATAALIPTISSTETLGGAGLLSWLLSADQSAKAHAGFDYSTSGSSVSGVKPIPGSSAGNVTGFKCVVNVPYTFTNPAGRGID